MIKDALIDSTKDTSIDLIDSINDASIDLIDSINDASIDSINRPIISLKSITNKQAFDKSSFIAVRELTETLSSHFGKGLTAWYSHYRHVGLRSSHHRRKKWSVWLVVLPITAANESLMECNHCQREECPSGNTTNMWNHVKSSHPSKIEVLVLIKGPWHLPMGNSW